MTWGHSSGCCHGPEEGGLANVIGIAPAGRRSGVGPFSSIRTPLGGSLLRYRNNTSLERCGCGFRNGVVLLSRSAADTDRTDDPSVLLQRNATSKIMILPLLEAWIPKN